MKVLDIGEVADQSGFKPSALRFYEEAGLISSISRHGLRRQFHPEVLLQLKLIAMGKSAGFSLDQIGGMFDRNGRPNLPRDVIHAKADEIDQKLRDLTALRDTLRHIADCPAPSHLECPTFRRLLEVAGAHDRKRPKRAQPKKAGSVL